MLNNKIAFLGVDTVVLDADTTKPLLINRDPEPMETGVPVDSSVYLEIVNFDFDEISLAATKVWVDTVLAFDGSLYDGTPASVQKPGFTCEWTLTPDTLAIRITPDSDFISLNRTDIRVVSETGDGTGTLDTTYAFTVEDKTSPVITQVMAWAQKTVRVHYGQPFVQKDIAVTSVSALFPWGFETLEYDDTLARWIKDDLTYPYTASGTETFALKNLDSLILSIDDGEETTVRFRQSSFVDKDHATAEEVAVALSSLLSNATAWAESGRIYVKSNDPAGSIQVIGGTSNEALGFDLLRHSRCLPYSTAEGEYELSIFATYNDGRIGEQRGTYELLNSDERFILEPIAESMQAEEALDPANYTIARNNDDLTPTATVSPVSAVAISSSVVELELDYPMTPGSPYILTASTVICDSHGNQLTEPDNQSAFTGWSPTVPAKRNLDLYEMLPKVNRTQDASNDLYRLMKTLQESLALVLYDVDKFPETWEPRKAPIEFVDAQLYDLGNPFGWLNLDDATKRRLVWNLVPIYKLKGTGVGIQAVLRLFLSIDCTILPYSDEDVWVLDESELYGDEEGEEGGTILGLDDRAALYTFNVEILTVGGIARAMTADEEAKARRLIDYMKCAHEHFGRFIQIEGEEVITEGWVLDVTELADVDSESGEIEGGTILMEDTDE